jgi:hypothetical protein
LEPRWVARAPEVRGDGRADADGGRAEQRCASADAGAPGAAQLRAAGRGLRAEAAGPPERQAPRAARA